MITARQAFSNMQSGSPDLTKAMEKLIAAGQVQKAYFAPEAKQQPKGKFLEFLNKHSLLSDEPVEGSRTRGSGGSAEIAKIAPKEYAAYVENRDAVNEKLEKAGSQLRLQPYVRTLKADAPVGTATPAKGTKSK